MKDTSICFTCSNARADKCSKILTGNLIEGSVAEGYKVTYCPNYTPDDGYTYLSYRKLAELSKLSSRTIVRKSNEDLIKLAQKYGYAVEVHLINSKRKLRIINRD